MEVQGLLMLPGRARVKVKELYGNPSLAAAASYYLLNCTGIEDVHINACTGKALILYDHTKIEENRLLRLLEDLSEAFLDGRPFSEESKEEKSAWWEVILSGAVLIAIIAKQMIAGKSSLSRSHMVFNLTAASTALTGYPVLRRGIQGVSQRRRINYELAASAAVFTFFILRESTLGLFTTLLLHLSKAAHSHRINETVNFIRSISKIRQSVSLVKEAEKSILDSTPLVNKMTCIAAITSGCSFLLTGDITRSLAILFIANPSSIREVYPATMSTAVGLGGKRGILIKNDNAFLKLSQIKHVCLSKDGTLTRGQPEVVHVFSHKNRYSEKLLLKMAAQGMEKGQYPYEKAIYKKAMEAGVPFPDENCRHVHEGPDGAAYVYKGKDILIGRRRYLESRGVTLRKIQDLTAQMASKGESPVFISINGTHVGTIGLYDPLRTGIDQSIKELQRLGIENFSILTADEKEGTEYLADSLNIPHALSNLSSLEKMEAIRELQREQEVAVVGDEMVLSPSFKEGTCRILLQDGCAEDNLDNADIMLLGKEGYRMVELMHLSKTAHAIGKQNLNIAYMGNLLGLFLVASGYMNPFTAALFRNACMLSILWNASRLPHIIRKNLNHRRDELQWKEGRNSRKI